MDRTLGYQCFYTFEESGKRCLDKNIKLRIRSKHMEIKYQYIQNIVQRGAVRLKYVPTDQQVADVLMKPLSRMKFAYFKEQLGIVENHSYREREN